MTHLSFPRLLVNGFRTCCHGSNAVALAVLLIASLVLWEFVVARDKPAAARSTSESTVRAPYDLSLIDADPDYYKRIDPLRLYETAPIPTGQKRQEEIRIVGEAYRLALPQSWLEQPLVVLAKPGRPVTFVALDSGKFPNDEVSITIKADGSGLASTSFFVTNEGRYRVLAASPENAGPAAFYVHCMSKTMRDDLRSGRYAEQYLAEVKANKKRQEAAAAEVVERIRQKRTIK